MSEIVMPIRVQRRRVRGWKKPENTIIVDRTSRWGNPYVFNNDRLGIARVPAIDGSAWEVEDRCSRAGTDHNYHHPDGKVTRHKVRLMTRAECVEAYRQALLNPRKGQRLWDRTGAGRDITVDVVRAELRGFNLACFCALNQLCHADVLLEVANQVEAPSAA